MKKTYNKMNLTYLMFLLLVKFVFTNIEPVISLQNIDPSIFVLKNANIQINPDELIKGHILINGKKIESVGKNIQIPKSAYEIDMTGKVIYPGFIDAWHEHANLDSNISNCGLSGIYNKQFNSNCPSVWKCLYVSGSEWSDITFL